MNRLLCFVLAVLLTACGGGSGAPRKHTVTVFAASSLTRAFAAEAHAFEAAHPSYRVALSFAGSQALVAQVQQGAPATVLATADSTSMAVVRAQLSSPAQPFAHNQLALITSPGNPLGLRTLKDLARKGLRVVVAGPTVPLGRATTKALAAAGVTLHPVSQEDSASGVVTKVRLGEAQAGIAYVTDLRGAVAGTPLPGTRSTLEIAPLTADAGGAAFIAFVLSPPGRQILTSFGFS